MSRKRARKTSIGFKASVETDRDLIDWWEAMPTGRRSNVLRDLIRAAILQQATSNQPTSSNVNGPELAQVLEDTAWLRYALSDLPGYLERLFGQLTFVPQDGRIVPASKNGMSDETPAPEVPQVDQETLDRRRATMSKTAW